MESDRVQQPVAIEYLEHMEALAAELDRAMHAVGANALSTFEDSVTRQQALCVNLRRAAERMASERRAGQVTLLAAGDNLDERIRSATLSLQKLNARYASLLKHSGDTVRLFAGLCRSYTGQFQPASQDAGSRQTWSCEL